MSGETVVGESALVLLDLNYQNGVGSLQLPLQLPLRVLFHAHWSNALSLMAHVGGLVSPTVARSHMQQFVQFVLSIMA